MSKTTSSPRTSTTQYSGISAFQYKFAQLDKILLHGAIADDLQDHVGRSFHFDIAMSFSRDGVDPTVRKGFLEVIEAVRAARKIGSHIGQHQTIGQELPAPFHLVQTYQDNKYIPV